jgi:DNA-binding PadR family transcriptional regulator
VVIMTPVFSHGDLRLYLLRLLDEAPRHGYDLMQALSDRTGGTYTPSAGTIYPRLAKLEEEGLVTKTVDGRKTVYEITDAGRAEVASRAHELEGIEAGLADSVRLIADEVRGNVREAMKSLRADLAAAAQAERTSTSSTAPNSSSRPADDERTASREQLRRADAAVSEFRATVRADLRTHVARGGSLPTSVVDALTDALGAAQRALTAAIRSGNEQR